MTTFRITTRPACTVATVDGDEVVALGPVGEIVETFEAAYPAAARAHIKARVPAGRSYLSTDDATAAWTDRGVVYALTIVDE